MVKAGFWLLFRFFGVYVGVSVLVLVFKLYFSEEWKLPARFAIVGRSRVAELCF